MNTVISKLLPISAAMNQLDESGRLKRVPPTEPQILTGDMIAYLQDEGKHPVNGIIDRFRPVQPASAEVNFMLVETVLQNSTLRRLQDDTEPQPGDVIFYEQGREGYAIQSKVRAVFRIMEATL